MSNHGHVLICIHRDPDATVRAIAAQVGITERAVQKIVHDLTQAGTVERTRQGRRNHYRVVRSAPLRHPVEAHETVGRLVDLLSSR